MNFYEIFKTVPKGASLSDLIHPIIGPSAILRSNQSEQAKKLCAEWDEKHKLTEESK